MGLFGVTLADAAHLLQDAVARQVDSSLYHAWCAHPLEVLEGILSSMPDREQEAAVARQQLLSWVEAGGVLEGLSVLELDPYADSQCKNDLCLLYETVGE